MGLRHIPSLTKEARLKEVARRYQRQAKQAAKRNPQSKPRTHAAIRMAELTRIFDDRWGKAIIENSDAGIAAAKIMAHHIGHIRDSSRRISEWLQLCAPWLDPASRERLITQVHECPLKWTADKVAWKLGITDETRTRLKLTTIGSIDVPRAERIKRRRLLKKAKNEAIRRAKGAKTRQEYRKSVKSHTPWVDANCSRATWYRRHRET